MTTMIDATNDEDEVLSGFGVVELHPDRSAVAGRVAEGAVAFRDRVLALAITQAQDRAALPVRVPPTPGVS